MSDEMDWSPDQTSVVLHRAHQEIVTTPLRTIPGAWPLSPPSASPHLSASSPSPASASREWPTIGPFPTTFPHFEGDSELSESSAGGEELGPSGLSLFSREVGTAPPPSESAMAALIELGEIGRHCEVASTSKGGKGKGPDSSGVFTEELRSMVAEAAMLPTPSKRSAQAGRGAVTPIRSSLARRQRLSPADRPKSLGRLSKFARYLALPLRKLMERRRIQEHVTAQLQTPPRPRRSVAWIESPETGRVATAVKRFYIGEAVSKISLPTAQEELAAFRTDNAVIPVKEDENPHDYYMSGAIISPAYSDIPSTPVNLNEAANAQLLAECQSYELQLPAIVDGPEEHDSPMDIDNLDPGHNIPVTDVVYTDVQRDAGAVSIHLEEFEEGIRVRSTNTEVDLTSLRDESTQNSTETEADSTSLRDESSETDVSDETKLENSLVDDLDTLIDHANGLSSPEHESRKRKREHKDDLAIDPIDDDTSHDPPIPQQKHSDDVAAEAQLLCEWYRFLTQAENVTAEDVHAEIDEPSPKRLRISPSTPPLVTRSNTPNTMTEPERSEVTPNITPDPINDGRSRRRSSRRSTTSTHTYNLRPSPRRLSLQRSQQALALNAEVQSQPLALGREAVSESGLVSSDEDSDAPSTPGSVVPDMRANDQSQLLALDHAAVQASDSTPVDPQLLDTIQQDSVTDTDLQAHENSHVSTANEPAASEESEHAHEHSSAPSTDAAPTNTTAQHDNSAALIPTNPFLISETDDFSAVEPAHIIPHLDQAASTHEDNASSIYPRRLQLFANAIDPNLPGPRARHNQRTTSRSSSSSDDKSKASQMSKTLSRSSSTDLQERLHGLALSNSPSIGPSPRRISRRIKQSKKYRVERIQKAKLAADQHAQKTGQLRWTKNTMIPDLDEEAEQMVQQALSKTRQETVATTSTKIQISRYDIGCVLPQRGAGDAASGWLNDEIIGAYLQCTVDYGNAERARNDVPRYHAFNSFFYGKLSGRRGYDDVKRWAAKAKIGGKDLLKVEYVFIPINRGGNHWGLGVLSPIRKTIEYYDSLHYPAAEVYTNLRKFLDGELGSMYDADEWTVLEDEQYLGAGKGPSQNNAKDCGVFASTTAKMIVLGVDPRVVRAEDMPSQRRRMVAEIINGGFTSAFKPHMEWVYEGIEEEEGGCGE